MTKGLNKLLFLIFEILLLVFFYKTAMFWLYATTFDEGAGSHTLNMPIFLLSVVIMALIVNNNKLHYHGIHFVCVLWFFIVLFVVFFKNKGIITPLKCVLWPLLFEVTYIIVKENATCFNRIVRLYVVFFVLGVYVLFISMNYNVFSTQDNMIYFVVLTIPMLLLGENNVWKNFLLIITTVITIVSMKRSMMLSVALFWLIFLGVNALKKGHRLRIIFVMIIVFGSSYIAFNFIDELSGGFMTARFEMEDMSNGRNSIYDITWQMQKQSTMNQWIFGHGHDAVRKNSPLSISAHNDWLEIVYDYGIMALFLYFCFWICLIKRWFFHYRTDSKYLMAYTLSLSIFAVMSMVSQLVLYVSYFLYLVMFWAIVEALSETDYKNYRLSMRKKKLFSVI